MGRKGQSAMEYMSTYGWAVLVVIIIGVAIWQMGLLDIGSRVNPGYSGFSVLTPVDWSLVKGGGTCTLAVQFSNAAGEEINSVSLSTGDACVPDTVSAGEATVCSRPIGDCGEPGKAFEENVVATYQRSSDNISFQTAGTIWGNIEGA